MKTPPPSHSLPTGQSVSDRDVSAHTKVLGLQDLIRRRVGKDSLGVNTSLVGESAESGDVVVAMPETNDLRSADPFTRERSRHPGIVV